ncbi:LysR substrate-binding domain-containing protein [Brevibacillus centrosporus]|uniref:DNA-binding transcriptional regulator, LysR family n=1 Tax=Brevibacillus centrosporus TaxID=54910 RepID=A0A1I4B0U4_9BACL|nr:LysR substrate-binding domain-containing protein [Brevibacillus centrosporus]MED4907871.1 LysR substrate-binding domain-containing protein [Brevibacillus centrosporus]SFK61539.1 DNA-binding transcriptional regulator, LysR family [Brevibacillus centrosporus]
MELRHIRYFLALAEELNFSRAAERLHIAQPPLSRQIQQLEDEVGVPLFYRNKRRVELTNAGKAFLEKAYEMIDLVEDACDTARMAARAEHGKLIIGFTGTAENLLPLLSDYRRRYPDVSLNLQLMGTTAQVAALQEKRIDVGILTPPVTNEEILVTKFQNPPLGVVLPENHPLAERGGPIAIAELAEESFVITPRSIGQGFYDSVTRICHDAGFSPKITVETHDMPTVFALVSAGMGISLTPFIRTRVSGVVFRELAERAVATEGGIAYRKGEKSEVLHSFLEMFWEFISNRAV